MSEDDLSSFDNERGWQIGATLQRFKTFQFDNNNEAKRFLVRLIQLSTPKEIHMQATPNDTEYTVTVLLVYEPALEHEARIVLTQIEQLYQDLTV